MTAKDLRNKAGFDRGVTREQRAINRRSKLQSPLLSSKSDGPKRAVPKGINRMLKNMRKFQAGVAALADFEKKLRAIEEERFGILPDRKNSDISFEEKQFGDRVACGTELCQFSVVSLALFDGETMLFACSGIVLPLEFGTVKLTRFLTSACLVREFNERRNRDDNLKIQVRLPNDKTTYGLLGLHDKDIAIVTSLGDLGLSPVYLNRWRTPDFPDFLLLQAAGRAFKSGCLMAMHGSPCEKSPDIFHSDSQGFTEAALGGPLVGNDRRFHGMIVDLCDDGGGNRKRAKFLSRKFLYEHLKLFQMQNPKELRSRDYSLHEGVSSVAPSGFMKTIYRLKSFGYPMPPPLMLEFNARLFNRFEDRFGELRAWKGYPFGDPPRTLECVWMRLKNEVVTKISRSVVSLKSFNGDNVRYFACTGLLIKWHGATARHTIILTSASLVRDHHNEDVIDKNLRIEVFLPPNQRSDGTLELYNLHYNIAIISVKKGFSAICPEDIFNKGRQKFSEKVVAIGRDTIHGLLMGTIGEVRKFSNKDCKLKYADLNWSTCKIKKAGIGGPLVDFEGTFVGMNFYDESSATPFLSRRKVVSALKGRENFELPSKSGDNPMPIKDGGRGGKQNRWPVPKPYWFHGALDEDTDEDMDEDEDMDDDTDDDPELTGGIQMTA